MQAARAALFVLHALVIVVVLFGWIADARLWLLQPTVAVSWFVNNGKCILSQLELWLVRSTLVPRWVEPFQTRIITVASACSLGVLLSGPHLSHFYDTISQTT